MPNVFFTSDNHFWHKNIIKFNPATRKNHTDVEEMNEEMIRVWNDTVALTDQVYCLGDFSFANPEKTENVLRRLKGQLHLIRGNHDKHWLERGEGSCRGYFEWVEDYKKLTIDGQKVVMFHYPIFEWEEMHHGAFHLFGHVHGALSWPAVIPGRAMDVGIDARLEQKDLGLWSWDEVRARLKPLPVRTHHGKQEMDR